MRGVATFLATLLLAAPLNGDVLLKKGVDLGCITGPMVLAVTVVETIFDSLALPTPVVITSVCDRVKPRPDSLHPRGFAVDFRTRDVPIAKRPQLADAVEAALGPEFDVILEPDHLHVEYDPR